MNNSKFSKLFKFIGTTLAIAPFLLGCNSAGHNASEEELASGTTFADMVAAGVPEVFATNERPRIMVLRLIGGDDHTAQFFAGAQQEGQAFGFDVTTITANGNAAQFHDALSQALTEGFDGVILSHGDDEGTLNYVRQLTAAGIPVAAFDSHSDIAAIEGATLTSQDDEALASQTLSALVASTGGEANIIYLWVDGFAPMVRRNNVYQEVLQENPGILEAARFGVAAEDTSLQTQNAVAAMLLQHGIGELDAIFATWDAFAIGAARALTEAGRSEIEIFSIDVSNQVLQLMQEEGSPWAYAAAVDPRLVGAVNMRLIALKLAGYETPDVFDLEASLISREALNASDAAVNMANLSELIPGWGETDAFEKPWMEILREANR